MSEPTDAAAGMTRGTANGAEAGAAPADSGAAAKHGVASSERAAEDETGLAATGLASGVTAPGPDRGPQHSAARGSGRPLAGMGTLIRLGLRRERLAIVIWVAAITATILASFPTLAELYPDEASRQALVGGIAATPAFTVITGPIESTSLGGLTAWRYGVLGGVAAALMAITLVIRRTRAEEESGRAELVSAGVVGRFAALGAALTVAGGACLLIGVLVAAGSIGTGEPAKGSVLLGVSLAGPGLVFAALAALAAQLVDAARAALGLAGAALAVAFALRAAGDSISGLGALSWISPLGWGQRLAAFGADRVWILWLFVAAGGVVMLIAAGLQARRDVGSGVWPARLGPAGSAALRSAWALAARLQRGGLVGWTIGFLLLGIMTGGMATDMTKLLAGNDKITEIMRQLGGGGSLADVLLATMAGLGGLLAAAYGIGVVRRVGTEETAGRTSPVLATAVGRGRYLAGHLVFALAGPLWLLLVAGAATGLLYGLADGRMGGALADGVASHLVVYPAVAVLVGIAVALHGWLPQAVSVAWAVLALSLLVGQLGPLLQLPQAAMDLSPFTHLPQLPAAPMTRTPVVALLVLAAVLCCFGVLTFRRRDLQGP